MNSLATPFALRLPDQAYWRDQIKCQAACPVNTDARGYVRAIAEGDYERAYLIARGPNPLASICGRVCGAPCESACRRGDLDAPIAIRALKRFVCERFGPEAREDGGKGLVDYLLQVSGGRAPGPCQSREELLPLLQSLTTGQIPKVKGRSVGIIGSGPAGLAAAHDLALLGFEVTLYEMEAVLGGMLALGIPEYRLPRDLIRAEVEVITAMGVNGVINCQVGRDIGFAELRERHDAVVVAVGARRSRKIPIPGGDAQGVLGGVEFLRAVALGEPVPMGRRVVVIGGGNVAYDVGRTVLRQISVDAARTARRDAHVGEVLLCSLESLQEMPADDIEIHEGDEEGILRRNSLGPKEILVDGDNNVVGVRFRKCLRVFDEARRFAPVYDEEDLTDVPCDTVILSVGQGFDLGFLDPQRDGVALDGRGLIPCDPESGRTATPGVYVAGDLAYGTKLLIHGVASGKAIARSIYEDQTGLRVEAEDLELHFPIPGYQREQGYEKLPRQAPAAAAVRERLMAQDRPVDLGFTEAQARCEASRCLDCGVNTIFDGDKCILCGGCVDVCPERCLIILPLDRIAAGGDVESIISAQLDGTPLENGSAILKDETLCIRCGLCAERCPNRAITMERFSFKEYWLCRAV